MAKKFIAYDIDWDIDKDELEEIINGTDFEDICEIMNKPASKFENMSDEQKLNIALDYFHHCPGAISSLIGVPDEIEIPEEIIIDADITSEDDDMSEVTDWLSDEYGFCINNYQVRIENR